MSPVNTKNLPKTPGVYIMKNFRGFFLYIGKAINIQKRVSSYFKGDHTDPRILKLISEVSTIETILTDNATEALLLENNLIKKHQPKYNIKLKDNKGYHYLKITNDDFPILLKTHRKLNDKAIYYGPYVSGKALKQTLKIIKDHFKLRRCKNMNKNSCLYYHINVCNGPCIDAVNKKKYADCIKQVRYFLEGNYNELIKSLNKKMSIASNELRYEDANSCKQQLEAIKSIQEKQKIEFLNKMKDYDCFVLVNTYDKYLLQVFRVKKGCLVQNLSFPVSAEPSILRCKIYSAAILQFFADHQDFPNEIIIDENINKDLQEFCILNAIKDTLPEKGTKFDLLQMLKHNASFSLKRELELKEDTSYEDVQKKLVTELNLKKIPNTVMGIDVSHLGGDNIVAATVFFEEGIPLKNKYRKYNIKTVPFNDDFASINEVVFRVFKKISPKQRPDLLLIDGGKGQLSAALTAFDKLEIKGQQIISLAKQNELIYLPNQKEAVKLDKRNQALKFLQIVRDEVHRFTIRFQRSKRKVY